MIDVILLISGNSKRMGNEKALLPFLDGKSFVCHLIDVYSKLKDSTLYIVLNANNEKQIKQAVENRHPNLVFLINPKPENGRLSSIRIGLNKMDKGKGVFIQNIDNPFVDKMLIDEMVRRYNANAFLVPQYHGKNGHPLLLGAQLVQELKMQQETITDLKRFLNNQEKHTCATSFKTVLANINTPEEYAKWFVQD